MAKSDLTKKAVLKAIAEFDQLGRANFLKKYKIDKSLDFFVVHKGHYYDSKALLGACLAAQALGRLGGKARAEKLSKKRRAEIAKKAAKARWC